VDASRRSRRGAVKTQPRAVRPEMISTTRQRIIGNASAAIVKRLEGGFLVGRPVVSHGGRESTLIRPCRPRAGGSSNRLTPPGFRQQRVCSRRIASLRPKISHGPHIGTTAFSHVRDSSSSRPRPTRARSMLPPLGRHDSGHSPSIPDSRFIHRRDSIRPAPCAHAGGARFRRES